MAEIGYPPIKRLPSAALERRAEAAETRVAELEDALREIRDAHDILTTDWTTMRAHRALKVGGDAA